jgi:hypothetical protein
VPIDSDTRCAAPQSSAEEGGDALDAERYLQAFRTRRDYCRSLLELSKRQPELIDRDDYTLLMETLGQKQRILGRMEELKTRHADISKSWPHDKSLLAADDRHACEELLAESEQLLVQLMTCEQQSTDSLIERRNRTESELHSLAEGSRVHEAYRDAHTPAARPRLDVDQ